VWYADEDPSKIPEGPRREEEARRREAKRKIAEYKKLKRERRDGGGASGGGPPPTKPKVIEPRIWWIQPDGTGAWKKRIGNAKIMIDDWGTRNLSPTEKAKARCRPRTSRIEGSSDRGHKVLEADTVYARRTHRVGYGIYANRDLRKGDIVGPYTGFPFACELLGRHTTGREEGTHRLSLRRLAAMPSNFTGIDGLVLSTPVNGNMYNLPYYNRNGYGSLLNSDLHSECNCKVVAEYRNYENRIGQQLFIDDEYCPDDVPREQRVITFALQ
jgi:hypothetical protein